MTGKRINTLDELIQAANEKRAVVCLSEHHNFGNRTPAAFVQNLQGRVLWMMLREGIYLYEKKLQPPF